MDNRCRNCDSHIGWLTFLLYDSVIFPFEEKTTMTVSIEAISPVTTDSSVHINRSISFNAGSETKLQVV
jgi:hypothetical protein